VPLVLGGDHKGDLSAALATLAGRRIQRVADDPLGRTDCAEQAQGVYVVDFGLVVRRPRQVVSQRDEPHPPVVIG
jgi:hypothetical protein